MAAAASPLAVVESISSKKTKIEQIPASSLVRDERVQRSVVDKRVRDLSRDLRFEGIGVATVSRRKDGKCYILDGQHRVLALIEAGHPDFEVTCRVLEGLTLAQEAALFRLLNNTARPTAMDDYLKGLVEGDPECLAIDAILKRNELRVMSGVGNGTVSCVAALRTVYRAREGAGPAALGFALSAAIAAWGTGTDSFDGHLVRGLGEVYLRYGEEVDRNALIKKLSKFAGGAPGVIGKAKARRDHQPGPIHRSVSGLVVDIYNNGRRNKLPTF